MSLLRHPLFVRAICLASFLWPLKGARSAEQGLGEVVIVHSAMISSGKIPTTSSRIFANNLELQMRALETVAESDTERIHLRQELGELYLVRGLYLDDVDEVGKALDQLNQCVTAQPNNAQYRLQRAKIQVALHRFTAAETDLEHAVGVGAPVRIVTSIRAELDWNLGSYAKASAAIQKRAADYPTYETLARLAKLQQDLGKLSAANSSFMAAESKIEDSNPIPVAWMCIQRGCLMVQMGMLDGAEQFFREAIRRFPEYVAASENLAIVLELQNRESEAIKVLKQLRSSRSHPELLAQLASLYRKCGDRDMADELALKADAAFEAILKKYPEAMNAHAGLFYLGEGRDPRRALLLLRENAKLRPNSESWTALAKAELANGMIMEARESTRKVLVTCVQPVELKELLKRNEFCDLTEKD